MVEAMLQRIIYKWVADNFGKSEADDPSWDIKALAEEISKHKHEIYNEVEHDYLAEDCDMVASDMGVKLTDQEREAIVAEYMDSEAYVDAHVEDWQWFIKQELKHREEK